MNRVLSILLRGAAILAIAVFVSSCDDDEDRDGTSLLIMTFDPRYEGVEIEIGDRIENLHGYPVEVTDMKFYISNMKLHLFNGNSIVLSDIELLDIRENKRALEFMVPSDSYSGISFDLGVPPNLNGTQNPDFMTSIYDPNHPLSESNGMYWTWQSGYRFFSFEGRCDTVPNVGEVLPLTFAFHTGTDTLFRSLPTFPEEVSLEPDEIKVVPFAIDVDSIFASATDTLDLKYERQFHGGFEQLPTGIKAANNTAASIRVIE
ncbi:MAG TPA: MbnP family protein [Cryomorphaceae bacterium]|nr:MbnP family protein [Cryomorphaceae bacterium]